MRKITLAFLALGFVGAMAVSTPIPAKAQYISFGGSGVGVEVIQRPYNHRYSRYDRRYDNQPYAYQYVRGPDRRYRAWNNCHVNGCNYRY